MPIDRSKPLPIHEFQNLIDEVAKLRELEAKATDINGAVVFQDEQEDGEMIQVSPGCYEGGIDGVFPTGEVLMVTKMEYPKDRDCDFPETIANFDNPKDAAHYVALRNAAPNLLDVLGMIRAGDAEKIQRAIDYLVKGLCIDGDDKMIECLHRYRDMANRMEANR